MSRLLSPPHLSTATASTTVVTQHQQYNSLTTTTTTNPTTNNNTSSIMIVIIVISSAIILSATIYLLLRFLSRRFHLSSRTTFSPNDVVSHYYINTHNHHNNTNVSSNDNFSNSLPLFTFSSLTGTLTAADCAVCLSKFNPHDHLRLLPLCCHAFHSRCIDTWLSNNHTCPLCRSNVHPNDSDVLNKILSQSQNPGSVTGNSDSFRIEIGSVSRRRGTSDSGENRRSYSVGSFEYIVDEAAHEVSIQSTTHTRGVSDCTSVDKDYAGAELPVPEPPGENLAGEVAEGRSWLREYVDRLAFVSLSSRASSFRSSGRFFTGSSRRSEPVIPMEDLEDNRIGEDISELFRWISGV